MQMWIVFPYDFKVKSSTTKAKILTLTPSSLCNSVVMLFYFRHLPSANIFLHETVWRVVFIICVEQIKSDSALKMIRPWHCLMRDFTVSYIRIIAQIYILLVYGCNFDNCVTSAVYTKKILKGPPLFSTSPLRHPPAHPSTYASLRSGQF